MTPISQTENSGPEPSRFGFVRFLSGAVVMLLVSIASADAQVTLPFSGSRSVVSKANFAETVSRLEKAVIANDMLLLSKASASVGAANAGFKIPGNAVLFVFRNDFARRILAENVAAGFEAPLRIYVTEDTIGRVTVSWRKPTGIFEPYGTAALKPVAEELDKIVEKIIQDGLK